MTAMRLLAQAKLNLVLHITGRAPDGFHLLDTLFHALELADELKAQRSRGGLSLTITAEDARSALPVADDNLVLRAARAFCERIGCAPDFAFALHKRIPPGGGLGGGSSDAAAALRLCNALCGDPLDALALHELARPLGADVAFFLRGGSQRGRGIGDQLTPAEVKARHFLLLLPPFGCPTAAVYKNFSAHWNGLSSTATVPRAAVYQPKDSVLHDRFENDLSAAAERVQPSLQKLRHRALALGAPPLHMTGSGSTLFLAAAAHECVLLRTQLQPLSDEGVLLLLTQTAAGQPVPELIDVGGA